MYFEIKKYHWMLKVMCQPIRMHFSDLNSYYALTFRLSFRQLLLKCKTFCVFLAKPNLACHIDRCGSCSSRSFHITEFIMRQLYLNFHE